MKRLDIVVPMAGRGQRFRAAGYGLPKPLIPVHGVPMIELVIRNLRPDRPHRFIFLCLEEHLARYGMEPQLRAAAPGSKVIPVSEVTGGAACTTLLARHHIDGDGPLMVANCDQWIDVPVDDFLSATDAPGLDGLIMTMTANDTKWSFVRLDEGGYVDLVVEKQPISHHATVGVYGFTRGRDFVDAATRMIAAGRHVNGEFYVAPAYNELIAAGGRIRAYDVGALDAGMYGLGTPEDLERFLRSPASRRAIGG